MKLQDFLHHLQQRRRSLLDRLPANTPLAGQLEAMDPALALAAASLAALELPRHPPQLVILGPTQAGKSTLVNLVLGQTAAGVSPLAGFTIHPHGFLHQVTEPEIAWLDEYFSPYRHLSMEELPRDRYDCFTTKALGQTQTGLPSCVVWDTPDFDSLRAHHYRQSLMKTAALADLLILVVSKDKYADHTVWELLKLLEPLDQPMLVCLNKVNPGNQDTLLRSWREKWETHRRDTPPPTVLLPYLHDPQQLQQQTTIILDQIAPLWKQASRYDKKRQDRVNALIRTHWSHWTAPIRAEHEARRRWNTLVESTLAQAIEIYRHDFLDHPIAYETLQRALAELLILLEIPGLARPMSLFRKVLTWPLRTAFRRRSTGRDEQIGELLVLNRSVEHALLQLQQALSQQRQQRQDPFSHWWLSLDTLYSRSSTDIRRDFLRDAETYYQDFQPQVEDAAHSLYRRLKDMPVTLNGLRAARASADAAGLALLVQTGGIGPHDLVLAPAMLSLTSWLSESALGKYMDRVAAELKQRQLEAVKSLLRQRLEGTLLALPDKIDTEQCFSISSETLEELERQIKGRRHGLKLF